MAQEKREDSPNRVASRLSRLHTTTGASQPVSIYASDKERLKNSVVALPEAPRYTARASDRIISVGVVDHHSFTRGCITQSLSDFDDRLEVTSFTAPEDCLQSTNGLDVILYYAHETSLESNRTQFAPIRKLLDIAPVIILSAADNTGSVIEALENGARGYIPTATTPAELVVEIIRLVKAGGTFVPPSGLPLQKITRKREIPSSATNQQFTPRQIAVLNHLTQGKPNKTIAYELAMSESTVKIHIRNIMKKMNASNRTEVACRAQAFAVQDRPT